MAEALISGWIMKTGVCWVWLMKEAPEPIAARSGLPFKWLILECAPLLPHAGIHFVKLLATPDIQDPEPLFSIAPLMPRFWKSRLRKVDGTMQF